MTAEDPAEPPKPVGLPDLEKVRPTLHTLCVAALLPENVLVLLVDLAKRTEEDAQRVATAPSSREGTPHNGAKAGSTEKSFGKMGLVEICHTVLNEC